MKILEESMSWKLRLESYELNGLLLPLKVAAPEYTLLGNPRIYRVRGIRQTRLPDHSLNF